MPTWIYLHSMLLQIEYAADSKKEQQQKSFTSKSKTSLQEFKLGVKISSVV